MSAVGLVFDRRRPDRGYAYVGASRCRAANKLFLVGKVRRTDWLPVRGDPESERIDITALSEDTDSDQPDTSDMESMSGSSDSDHEQFDWQIENPERDDESMCGFQCEVDMLAIHVEDIQGLF